MSRNYSNSQNFLILGYNDIVAWLETNAGTVVTIVESTYLEHLLGNAINPPSSFLRFPDSERNRIISLASSLESGNRVAGVKWISSFPENLGIGLRRASGVIILNDRDTGYPLACLEASAISAARTAASAIVGACYLHASTHIRRLGIVGCGMISRTTLWYFQQLGWDIDEIAVTDLDPERASRFRDDCGSSIPIEVTDLEHALVGSDVLVLATSAVIPFIKSSEWLKSNPTVLHLSLRDLSVPIILHAQNIADDVDLCMKAQTSIHLAEQNCGNRLFMDGNVAQLISGTIKPDFSRPRVFSPFGMGMLDLAVARAITEAEGSECGLRVKDFAPR